MRNFLSKLLKWWREMRGWYFCDTCGVWYAPDSLHARLDQHHSFFVE